MVAPGVVGIFRMNLGAKTERWKLIQEIFQSAIELPAAARNEYLARVCGDDEKPLSEVATLLDNDSDNTATLHSVVERDLKQFAGSDESIGCWSASGAIQAPTRARWRRNGDYLPGRPVR
jgi:hypothetical protein